MKRSVLRTGASALLATVLVAGPLAASALACAPHGHDAPHSKALPSSVFAPYLDVTAVDSIAQTAKESRSKYLTLAFLQADKPGSCELTWAGDPAESVASGALADQIAKIRKAGGDVIPSFGGYSATNDIIDWANNPANLTEIADSCKDVTKLAQAYEQVVTTYGVTRLDFDIEGTSITNKEGVDRRNEAAALVQKWAKKNHRTVEISYTLPSSTTGLVQSGLDLLKSAAAHGVEVSSVNIMTFDYWDGAVHDMVADAEQAATALTGQLKATILPHASQAELWRHVGVVQMIGTDDYRSPEGVATDIFTPQQAVTFERWAKKHQLAYLGFWALQRDNGSCPDATVAQNNCSGIEQDTWAFTQAFKPFTSNHR
ncbi:chitinase [Luteimicrobium sp. NPDC057192]|uniref:chitinase n=1 Tax=Luteimicrobium sp. NPDC057192 TaxID=3346042 RepID=UPI00362D5DC2